MAAKKDCRLRKPLCRTENIQNPFSPASQSCVPALSAFFSFLFFSKPFFLLFWRLLGQYEKREKRKQEKTGGGGKKGWAWILFFFSVYVCFFCFSFGSKVFYECGCCNHLGSGNRSSIKRCFVFFVCFICFLFFIRFYCKCDN